MLEMVTQDIRIHQRKARIQPMQGRVLIIYLVDEHTLP